MAYATSNPPILVRHGVAAKGQRWVYQSTDNASTVAGSKYFSNGQALGMKVNDIVEVTDTDASPAAVTFHIVTAVASDGVTVSAGSDVGIAAS